MTLLKETKWKKSEEKHIRKYRGRGSWEWDYIHEPIGWFLIKQYIKFENFMIRCYNRRLKYDRQNNTKNN